MIHNYKLCIAKSAILDYLPAYLHPNMDTNTDIFKELYG